MNVGFWYPVQLWFTANRHQSLYNFLHAKPEDLPILVGPMTGLLIQPLIGALVTAPGIPRWDAANPIFSSAPFLQPGAVRFFRLAGQSGWQPGCYWILDAANNTAMEPYRAFIADKLPDSQRPLVS